VSTDTFVYVTYIRTTPDKVWTALLEGEVTRQYWGGNANLAAKGWTKGAPWQHVAEGGKGALRVVGEVLELVPQQKLVLSWAEPGDAANPDKHSRVALEIETVGDMVKLTVTHDQLDLAMSQKISKGWPLVCASMKSFLETGRPLAIFGSCAPPVAGARAS
jgi:uncharacterized protein YndB with AHSA1/START domain